MNNRQPRTGAQALIATLRTHGVDTIFGIPGVHTLPIYDAIREETGLRHILARHEQGAGFMAEGYARVTGRPGVVCTITGPGVTNVATAAADAYADSIPLLIISSALPTPSQGQARGELHEVKNQLGIMESLVGWTRAINAVDEIPCAIYDAFLALRQERPRGAYLQIPLDLLEQTTWVDIPDPAHIQLPQPEMQAIQQAIDLLCAAQRPIIIAGAGVTVSGANTQLQQLAELLQAPVILGSKSHDILPTEHPLILTTNDTLPTELCTLTEASDLVLIVGSKLGAERTDGGRLPLPVQRIHIDIDPTEINHNYAATIGIVSDARLALEALLTALSQIYSRDSIYRDEIPQVRAALLQKTQQMNADSFPWLEGLRTGLNDLPRDRIIIADMTLAGYACAQYFPVYQPRTFIHPAEFCTIGCGLPLALGAQVAAPKQAVIAICGDGGFLLNASELATAVQEKLPVIIIIFNDSSYATVKKEQRRRFERRYIATDLIAPDYVALARAFHAQGIRVESPAELAKAVVNASKYNGPSVIEVPLPAREW